MVNYELRGHLGQYTANSGLISLNKFILNGRKMGRILGVPLLKRRSGKSRKRKIIEK